MSKTRLRPTAAGPTAITIRLLAFLTAATGVVVIPAALIATATGLVSHQAALAAMGTAAILILLAAVAVRPFDPL